MAVGRLGALYSSTRSFPKSRSSLSLLSSLLPVVPRPSESWRDVADDVGGQVTGVASTQRVEPEVEPA